MSRRSALVGGAGFIALAGLLLWACGSGGGGGAGGVSGVVGGGPITDVGPGVEVCLNFLFNEGTPAEQASINRFAQSHTRPLRVEQAWAATLPVTDPSKVAWSITEPTRGGGTLSSPLGFTTNYTAPEKFPTFISGTQTQVVVQATLTSVGGSVCKVVRISLNENTL